MQPGGVGEQVANRHELLAAGRELRPVRGHRLVVADQAAVGEAVHRGGHDAFRRREAHRHRVGLPRIARRVARAGPRVDHQLAAVVHGDRGAAAPLVSRDAAERLGDATEVRVHRAGDHARLSSRRSGRTRPREGLSALIPEERRVEAPRGFVERYEPYDAHRVGELAHGSDRDLGCGRRRVAEDPGRYRRERDRGRSGISRATSIDRR